MYNIGDLVLYQNIIGIVTKTNVEGDKSLITLACHDVKERTVNTSEVSLINSRDKILESIERSIYKANK